MNRILVYSYFCPGAKARPGGVQQIVPGLLSCLSEGWVVRVAHPGPCEAPSLHHRVASPVDPGKPDDVEVGQFLQWATMLRELSRSADVLLSIDRILPPIPDRPQVLMCNTLAYLNEATAAASPSWTSIVVPSSHFGRQVRQVHPVSLTHVVPYAISPTTLERTGQMTPATGHRVRLPHRPDRRKGHVEAIKGLARAVGSTEPIDIDIAWLHEPRYEEYRQELRSIAEREGVADRVHFFGWMDDDARWQGIESAQAVLQLGPFEETFGLAVVDAILCGRLAITRPQPAVREIVGSTPLLVEIDDPFNWADALERSVAATRDARATKDARQHLAALTMTSMVRGYDAVFRRALSQVNGRL